MKTLSRLAVLAVLGCAVMAMADVTVPVTIPEVPAVQAVPAQAVEAKAVITTFSVIYLPPAYTQAMYRVTFDLTKPDGTVIRRDTLRIDGSQLSTLPNAAQVQNAMTVVGGTINAALADYVSKVSTNANWLSGKPAPYKVPAVK